MSRNAADSVRAAGPCLTCVLTVLAIGAAVIASFLYLGIAAEQYGTVNIDIEPPVSLQSRWKVVGDILRAAD